MKDVIIVGAGIGGISTGIRLLKNGYKVTIIEKEDKIGGKLNQLHDQGYKFDLTASILMTPQIYIELFNYINKDYTNYIELIKLDTMYKVFYNDKSTYEFYSDIGKTIKYLENMNTDLSRGYLSFISKSYNKYTISNENFLEKPMEEFNDMVNFNSIKKILKINPVLNSAKYISNYIKDEKLKNYLIFQTMYIGINPYKSSNLYTLIPTISQVYGLWYIKGGMYSYIKALEKVFLEMGGNLHNNTNVKEIIINNDFAKGVVTDKGIFRSNMVICNSDFPYTINNLINKKENKYGYTHEKIKSLNYSCSTFIIYLVLRRKYKNLKVHNIYIGKNFRENIQAPFIGSISKDPSLYIYCPSRVDRSICKNNEEVLNIILRVPNLSFKEFIWDDKLVKCTRNKVLKTLKNIKGMEDIEENILYESYLTPKDLKDKFNSFYGTAFGIGHNLNQIGYFRPHMKSKGVKNLYFIGSSTHPGNGVSVVIKGSKLLVDEIIKNS